MFGWGGIYIVIGQSIQPQNNRRKFYENNSKTTKTFDQRSY